MGKDTYKSIGAVVAGLITGAVLSIGTDFALGALGIFPPIGTGTFLPWMLVLAFIYRSIYAAAGGFVTAMLAPNQPMRHVVILGIIGIMVSAVGVVVGWRLSDHWYPIALVVIALPCTWLGGKLKTHNR